MAVDVIFPKVDMDMDSGTLARWHVEDGAEVRKGQPLFDIETAKAAMEIEAPANGVLHKGPFADGSTIAIGTVIGFVLAAGEQPKPFASPAASALPAAATPMPKTVDVPATSSITTKPRATPLARRLARQAGLDLAKLVGSGPRGRIVAGDVKVPAQQLEAPASASLLKPLDAMRRTIAQRLTQSKQTIPHFYLTATCTIDTLLALRERLNAAAPKNADGDAAYKLSVTDFTIKALALALQKVPDANVTFADDGLLQHIHSDVAVAVAVDGGMFTPVLRRAEEKSLSMISQDLKALATRARARSLQPSDYQGGSASISNLGMYGVEQFTAIINPPQACILAVGAAVERFVPVNKQPVLATQVALTLSCDHRAMDGVVAARLLATVKSLLEDPALMLV
jgi:pyruvate dehydrogenase E2 component (dihydrolipoamide acetyltransferase)